MTVNDTQEHQKRRRERLEAMGAVPCPDYKDREGQTLVTFFGEARAELPDPHALPEAEHERDLAVELASIERDLRRAR
jgi:hypothetical protein